MKEVERGEREVDAGRSVVVEEKADGGGMVVVG